MKRFLPLALLALAVAITPASAQDRREPRLRPAANPSAVIARELEFAQAAQDKGQWTAFREFAARDAVMFVPQAVLAQSWLKNRPNPPVAVKWQPAAVWSSCDGSLVVSQGAWQKPGSFGYFTTIWQRQDDGSYKWVFDHGDTLVEPLAVPEMIPAHVAECPADARRRPPPVSVTTGMALNPAAPEGRSNDGTLSWSASATADGAHNLSVEWRQDGAMQQLLIEEVAAPGAGG